MEEETNTEMTNGSGATDGQPVAQLVAEKSEQLDVVSKRSWTRRRKKYRRRRRTTESSHKVAPIKGVGLDELLNDREKTYGNWRDNARVAQATKELWKQCSGWERLGCGQRECLEMIAHKVARMLCGDPGYGATLLGTHNLLCWSWSPDDPDHEHSVGLRV